MDEVQSGGHTRLETVPKGEFIQRYMFDVRATITSQSVGESPKGERVDIQYDSGEVSTQMDKFVSSWWDPLSADQKSELAKLWKSCGLDVDQDGVDATVRKFRKLDESEPKKVEQKEKRIETLKDLRDGKVTPLPWFGFEGQIISGSDWATFRPDLVADFSGRMTLKSADSDAALIDAIFSGVVDLCPSNPTVALSDPRGSALEAWRSAKLVSAKILLSVTFDVGKAAQKWAPKRYIRQGKGYWKYQRLTQSQFIAIGDLAIGSQAQGLQVNSVDLSVFEIRPAPPMEKRS